MSFVGRISSSSSPNHTTEVTPSWLMTQSRRSPSTGEALSLRDAGFRSLALGVAALLLWPPAPDELFALANFLGLAALAALLVFASKGRRRAVVGATGGLPKPSG